MIIIKHYQNFNNNYASAIRIVEPYSLKSNKIRVVILFACHFGHAVCNTDRYDNIYFNKYRPERLPALLITCVINAKYK